MAGKKSVFNGDYLDPSKYHRSYRMYCEEYHENDYDRSYLNTSEIKSSDEEM